MGIPRDRAMKCIMKQKWIFNLDCETIKTYCMAKYIIQKPQAHNDNNRRTDVNVVFYYLCHIKT